MSKIVMIVGFPASGKSSLTEEYIEQGYVVLNRDSEGGKIASLVPKMEALIDGGKDVVLDNTFGTVAERLQFIDVAHAKGAEITCDWLQTSIEDAQFNACYRMMERVGKILEPHEFKAQKSPNLFPPAVLFSYRKKFEKPTVTEGFDTVVKRKFERTFPADWTGKAVFLDYDGTLRDTLSGDKWPSDPKDVYLLPRRKEVLEDYRKQGYQLIGVSNQSAIGKGTLTEQQAMDCFSRTNELLEMHIDVSFCPHSVPPINCYCRKPMPGMAVQHFFLRKLDPRKCIMVGDMTSDKTFAKRSHIGEYVHERDFFA